MGKGKWRIFLLVCIMLCSSLGSSASAIAIPFDERPVLERVNLDTGESEIVPFGTYYASGTASITEIGTGRVNIFADTSCYRVCDTVTVGAYLYRGTGSGTYVTQVNGSGTKTSYVSASKNVAVLRGYYYHVEGSHSAKKNSTSESGSSYSGSIYVG